MKKSRNGKISKSSAPMKTTMCSQNSFNDSFSKFICPKAYDSIVVNKIPQKKSKFRIETLEPMDHQYTSQLFPRREMKKIDHILLVNQIYNKPHHSQQPNYQPFRRTSNYFYYQTKQSWKSKKQEEDQEVCEINSQKTFYRNRESNSQQSNIRPKCKSSLVQNLLDTRNSKLIVDNIPIIQKTVQPDNNYSSQSSFNLRTFHNGFPISQNKQFLKSYDNLSFASVSNNPYSDHKRTLNHTKIAELIKSKSTWSFKAPPDEPPQPREPTIPEQLAILADKLKPNKITSEHPIIKSEPKLKYLRKKQNIFVPNPLLISESEKVKFCQRIDAITKVDVGGDIKSSEKQLMYVDKKLIPKLKEKIIQINAEHEDTVKRCDQVLTKLMTDIKVEFYDSKLPQTIKKDRRKSLLKPKHIRNLC